MIQELDTIKIEQIPESNYVTLTYVENNIQLSKDVYLVKMEKMLTSNTLDNMLATYLNLSINNTHKYDSNATVFSNIGYSIEHLKCKYVNIICNYNTMLKYSLLNNDIANLQFIYNDYIEDDVIYLVNYYNEKNTPGYKFIYGIKDNEVYSAFTCLDVNNYEYCIKMVIPKLEDVITKETDIDILTTNRTLPLSQCVLINTITFGVKGMSPTEIENMKHNYIIQHEDYKRLLQKTFYIFTEYFLYDKDSNKTTIDIKLI